MTQPGYGHMRASDAERERAVDVLKAAFTEGRLSQDEYTDRVGEVQVSKTYGDLAELVHDVPIGPFGSLPPAPAPAYPGYPPALAGPAYPPVLPYQGYPLAPYYPPLSGYAPVYGPGYPPVGPYQPGPALVVPRQRDALAVTSLAVALAAVTFPPAAFAAVGLGIAALVRIRQTGRLGRNFAIAGIALGTLGTLIFIALIVPALAGR
jgi:Domain of unknown function (DUF1707)/Domain of unknown function (DUF4190)